jgi:hypothetical protein
MIAPYSERLADAVKVLCKEEPSAEIAVLTNSVPSPRPVTKFSTLLTVMLDLDRA